MSEQSRPKAVRKASRVRTKDGGTPEAPYGFRKDGKPRKRPLREVEGRPKGTKNVMPKHVASIVLRAAELAGDKLVESMKHAAKEQNRKLTKAELEIIRENGQVAYLSWLAIEDTRAFSSLVAKIIPTNVNLSLEEDTARLVARAIRARERAQGELGSLRMDDPPAELVIPAERIN